MKKILLLLIQVCPCLLIGQYVEIRLVDQNIGQPVYDLLLNSYSAESNDAGLNAIFAMHNVFLYEVKGGYPYPLISSKIMNAVCNCNVDAFLSDLTSYTAVVQSAAAVPPNVFTDALYSKLQMLNVGIPTGQSNNLIATNDQVLTNIFENYNVYYYEQAFPSSTNPDLLKVYLVVCNCDKNLLMTELNNYDAVIDYVEPIRPVYILNTEDFVQFKNLVYPNPFTSTFNIETSLNVSSFELFSNDGRGLGKTRTKSELDNIVMGLPSGIYILVLKSSNITIPVKLIKN